MPDTQVRKLAGIEQLADHENADAEMVGDLFDGVALDPVEVDFFHGEVY